MTTLLFDEIQNVPSWELIVNRLQRQGYRPVITGSNALKGALGFRSVHTVEN